METFIQLVLEEPAEWLPFFPTAPYARPEKAPARPPTRKPSVKGRPSEPLSALQGHLDLASLTLDAYACHLGTNHRLVQPF